MLDFRKLKFICQFLLLGSFLLLGTGSCVKKGGYRPPVQTQVQKKSQSSSHSPYCYGFAEFCKSVGGVQGIYKDSCSCNTSNIGHPALCEPGENPCGAYYHDHCLAGGHMCLDVGKKWPLR